MTLQNLQQYGCQIGNKLKEKSRVLNRSSSRFYFQIKMKQCSVADTKTGVLGGVILKLDIL
jgi:hypothetical protein